jgi:anti-anti-sigma regulatory factor
MLDFRVLEPSGDAVHVVLRGQLAFEPWTDRLRAFLEEHYVNDGVSLIELDLEGVDRIDLEGISTLLVLRAEARSNEKQLVASNSSGQVRRSLEERGVLAYLEGRRDS